MSYHLISACIYGPLDEVKRSVEKGADIHFQEDNALRTAIDYDKFEIVKYLIKHGANVNVLDCLSLKIAVYNNNFKISKYLVDNGSYIKDNIFNLAIKVGNIDIINCLKEAAGPRLKCYECIVRVTCLKLCNGWNRK